MVPSRLQVGTTVTLSGMAGTGAAGEVAVFNSADTIIGDPVFTFDGSRVTAPAFLANNNHDGATRIQISNTDAGAGAFAQMRLTTDAGDMNWTVNSTAAGDSCQFTADSTFGGGLQFAILGSNTMSFLTNGATNLAINGSGKTTIGASGGAQFHDVNGRGFNITFPTSGTSMFLQMSHTSNSAGSGACFFASVAGTSGGDVWTQYVVTGSTEWCTGLDISDDRAYVISGAGAVGSNNVIRCDRNTLVANIPNGVRTKYSIANTANPPTIAELTSAFGTPSDLGSGFIGILNDADGGVNEYIVWTDATNWFHVAGVKAA